jgi:mono/diheme cytochrome c family protein
LSRLFLEGKAMRIQRLLVLLLFGSLFLAAQDATTKIKTVAVRPTSSASGPEMFAAYCASCHGPDGAGNGPAAPALKMRPANLALLAQHNGGKFPALLVMNSIQDGAFTAHGSKEMPVWGPVLLSVSRDSPIIVKVRIANLTAFIESLQVKQ